jgi:hypothetical protein
MKRFLNSICLGSSKALSSQRAVSLKRYCLNLETVSAQNRFKFYKQNLKPAEAPSGLAARRKGHLSSSQMDSGTQALVSASATLEVDESFAGRSGGYCRIRAAPGAARPAQQSLCGQQGLGTPGRRPLATEQWGALPDMACSRVHWPAGIG